MKYISVMLGISLLLNIYLLWRDTPPPFMPDSLHWGDFHLEFSGIFIFDNEKLQPQDTVQFLKISCIDHNVQNECYLVDGFLNEGKYVAIGKPDKIDPIGIGYRNKSAVFKWQGCTIVVEETTVGFDCGKGKSGMIGSHISHYYK